MEIAGIVLAAGGGSRYGGPKALVRFGGELLVERACRMLAEGGCRPVTAVLGAGAAAVRAAAPHLPSTVDNLAWASGIGSSLRAGLAAVPAGAEAVVVALADEPLVGAAAVRRLIAAYGASTELAAVVATYGGQQRNPVLLSRAVFAEVAASAAGDRGARAWLRAHPERVAGVPCDDTGNALDVDTPADLGAALAAALARAERGE
ncbi:MAG TPA: nucleotidyltransferase family protein [Mycobacteriales bacterium]|nr:nucleotidyltransferase family protein [Mycobacteriales bacterium]